MADLAHSLRIQAHANALANLRLHTAMAPLSQADLQAQRTSFFQSLLATLNHILAVDGYYIAALVGDPNPEAAWYQYQPAADLPPLAVAQRKSDLRLVAFCDALDAAGCDRVVDLPRGGGRIQRDRAAHVLAHLYMHQTHHRGQVHAMLAGTTVKPPQLDEFLMPSEAHLRTAEMQALGWDERAVYGPLAAG
ncbi:MAG: DinB family protein [Betaproteobacteria bacterium]|nr:DinB family protein [Betaproteobacteria bacterium]MCC6248102.1 DinB family protein [Rubrivivax sp.]MCL4696440.1 DinB family protein [Burkholderiaceae bacterium]